MQKIISRSVTVSAFCFLFSIAFCFLFSIQLLAAYKLPAPPYPGEKVPDATYMYNPYIAEENSEKSKLSLKDAYEKNLPYAKDTVVVRGCGVVRNDFDNYQQAKALYGITEEEYNYLSLDMPGLSYSLRYMEQLSGFDYDSFFNMDVPRIRKNVKAIANSAKIDRNDRYYSDYLFFEHFLKEKQMESKDAEIFHLGMAIDEKYPEMVLDNFVYHNGKIMFSVITYGAYNNQAGNAPRFDVYNKKTGTTMGARWGGGIYTDSDSIDGELSLHLYYIYLYGPEDLEDIVLCYDNAYMKSIFKR